MTGGGWSTGAMASNAEANSGSRQLLKSISTGLSSLP
jgi:hypothetical protein